MTELSIVIPVFNEGEPLRNLTASIIEEAEKIVSDFEIILIDDYSIDNSWQILKELSRQHKQVKVAKLIKNFGQHNALSAGLSLTKGNYVVMMDCDGQDSPSEIINLYNKIQESAVPIVYAKRQFKKASPLKKIGSIFINFLLSILSGYKHDPQIGTFRIMKRKVVEAFLQMPEKKRYIGGMFYWLNFKSDFIKVEHKERLNGVSNYNLSKSIKLARLGILSSSTKLLSIGVYIGLICSFLSFLFGLYFIYLKIKFNVPMGYTSIVVSIFFVGGIIMLILGVIGEYLGELFDEVKSRPTYIIDEKHNF